MNLFLNCEDNNVTLNKKNYLLKAAKRLALPVSDYPRNLGVHEDYILNIEPYTFIEGAKWTGVWEIDLLLDRGEMNAMSWNSSNSVFLATSVFPPRLERFRDKTHLMFQACDTVLQKRTQEPEYDITFAGTMEDEYHRERFRAYERLRSVCTLETFERGHPMTEYVNIMSKARVQFVRSMNTQLADGELAQRFFESLAIGPVLTNYVEDLQHTGLVEGVDYLSYKNDGEMLEKLDFLLNNPEEAKKIAYNGRQKALAYHTYDARLMQIFNQIYEDTST